MSVPPEFHFREGRLQVEEVDVTLLAERHATPLFVYSLAAIRARLASYSVACRQHDARICYAVKANSNLAILEQLARAGAGFDIVSGGELERVIAARGEPGKVIFSGVGKSRAEMELALRLGIACFNVESLSELRLLAQVAHELGRVAPISVRVNPDVDPKTHPYIATGLKQSKFGIAIGEALAVYQEAARIEAVRIVGVDCHIGSQLTDEAPLLESLERLIELIDQLAAHGIEIEHLDLGGGLGVAYHDESTVDVSAFLGRVLTRIDRWRRERHGGRPIRVLLEPGRSIVAAAGILVTRVQYLKTGAHKNFAIVDAAMNDLLRPALYDAWHDVVPVSERRGAALEWDIVGPICESADWLARGRALALAEGDLLAFLNAGAYAMSMASNYNTRGRAAEVMVDGQRAVLVREREPISQLFALERLMGD